MVSFCFFCSIRLIQQKDRIGTVRRDLDRETDRIAGGDHTCFYRAEGLDSILSGHGGGDSGIMNSLYDLLCGEVGYDELSNISVSVKNHTTVFAAEKSRLEGRVVELSEM